MKDSIRKKLQYLNERYQELSILLSDGDVISDQKKFQAYSKEYAQLEPIHLAYTQYIQIESDLITAEEMSADPDPEMKTMALEEIKSLTLQLTNLMHSIEVLLLPVDPNDTANVFLEIRAGTGGDEAAIFVGDLFKMYARYAETKGWRIETISENLGDHGGYKEIISKVTGKNVYTALKFESGAHRVQRVPLTESQGRVHTSACTVAILPEADEIEGIEVNSADLRIDTFRASGAGGQHVNKTDSAIRITHIPTGLVVECQDQRSQHKNKASALSILKARLLQAEQTKQQTAQSEQRRQLVGSGDRSERIRTYNYPQGRVTDHRINLTLYKLNEVLEGDLDAIITPLSQEHQADLLAQSTNES